MAQTGLDRLRELGAYYWKPALTTVSAVVAGLNSAKGILGDLGISVDELPLVASGPAACWGAVIALVGVLALLRFQRLGFVVTRFLLGAPKAPGAGYRNGYRRGRLPTAEGAISLPPEIHRGTTPPGVSRPDYPARFGLDRFPKPIVDFRRNLESVGT